jgi:hypothetical protein
VTALRWAATLAGLLVAAWLVSEVGLAALAAQVAQLSWRLPLVLLPQVAGNTAQAAGWSYAFPRERPPLLLLLRIRLAGEAVNDTTPTATLGGEALKALLVARTAPGLTVQAALVSVVVAKTALVSALAVFVGGGLAVAWAVAGAPPALLAVLAALAAFTGASSAAFAWAQLHGLFRLGGRALAWLGLGARAAALAAGLDRDLRRFYATRRRRLAASWALHLGGWAAGILETWLTLRFLGAPVSLATALVIEAGAAGARAAGFLVPASLGVQEGGVVGIAVLLGVGGEAGLAVAVVRRIREAVLVAAGYACLALARRRHGGPGSPHPATGCARD